MRNPWSDRWQYIIPLIQPHQRVIDFGCGNKEFLDFYQARGYLGIDLYEPADLLWDLHKPLQLVPDWDLGLLLGVLEYVNDPDQVLLNIRQLAKEFIVMVLPVKKKPSWQRSFTRQSINDLLQRHWQCIQLHICGRYLLFQCHTPRI